MSRRLRYDAELAKELNVSRNTILNDFERQSKDYCLAFQVNVMMKSIKELKLNVNKKTKKIF